ncbi:MAG: glycosyltransferase family 39 protein [Patescibacteria group bacterium]|jgi:hypothetical protein
MTIQTFILRARAFVQGAAKEPRVYVVAITLVAFFAYAFFSWATIRQAPRFNSPDETANYFFSFQVANGVGLSYPEPLSALSNGVIHPRATIPVGNDLVPASFVGLPMIFGATALVFGLGVLPYLTAVMTALALMAAYGCWRCIFNVSVALAATVLLAMHPAIWYYASRGFYHNILFLDLVIFSVWGFVHLERERNSVEWLIFSIIMFVGALIVRSSEVLWLFPLALFGLWHLRHHIRLPQIVIAGSLCAALLTTIVLLFTVVYDAPLPVGYQAVRNAASLTAHGNIVSSLLSIIVPFGFHPLSILTNVFFYCFLVTLPFWMLVFFGGYLRYRERERWSAQERSYVYAAVWVTLTLGVYYGSWRIADTVGPQHITLGISYVRYWLPIFVVWLPFAGYGVMHLLGNVYKNGSMILVLLLVLGFSSFLQVYFDSSEGLAVVASRLATYRTVSQTVNALTGTDSVIVGDRIDKIFFPERSVISPGDRPFTTYTEVIRVLPTIADNVPLYLYSLTGVTPETVELLKQYQVVLHRPFALPDGAWLYPLVHL